MRFHPRRLWPWGRIGGDTGVEVAADGALGFAGKPNARDWCEAAFTGSHGDVVVRCTAEPLGSCSGVKIQLGSNCQAIVLRQQGAFLYCKSRASSHDGTVALSRSVQIVLRRRGHRASAWVDGKVDAAAAPLGIGCVGGPARSRDLAIRKP